MEQGVHRAVERRAHRPGGVVGHGRAAAFAQQSGTQSGLGGIEGGRGDHELYDAYASDSVDRSGDGGPATVVLCGAYQLDPSRARPLLPAVHPALLVRRAARPRRDHLSAVARSARRPSDRRSGS
ncbi:cupin domain-containing protein [Streptomyces sp. NBC_01244]|uniref:cupin domain-containing protein n=1 Tax=Streptomyces sp. NBC_01244 TaxID=2903797 RepID=UPI002E0F3D40|nr:cupin domain-containing protein [Streptomyces sp. NBC_01244]